MSNLVQTHWFGCWRHKGHHACAEAMVERSAELMKRMADVTDHIVLQGRDPGADVLRVLYADLESWMQMFAPPSHSEVGE